MTIEKKSNPRRKSPMQFIAEVEALTGRDYTFLSEYTTAVNKIPVRHNLCGAIYEVKPNNFLNGQRCRECRIRTNAKTQMKTHEKFIEELRGVHGDEYAPVEEYAGVDVPINVLHKKCGRVEKKRPSNLLSGSGCLYCGSKKSSKSHRLTHEEFIERLKKLPHSSDYKILEEYSGHRNKIEVLHTFCGHQYRVTANNFLSGKECPKCISSKGESKVSGALDSIGVKYIQEVTFPDLRNKLPLRYDFGILNHLGKVVSLIEYDGRQHFEPSDFFGGQGALDLTQYRDALKTEYAKEKGLPLLRISYKDYKDVEEIVKKFYMSVK